MGKTKAKKPGKSDHNINRHSHSLNVNRPTSGLKGVAKPRDRATINRLKMYKNFKPIRDRKGKIIKAAPYQGKVAEGTVAR